MKVELTEVLWLDEQQELSLAELAALSGLSEAELYELMDYGVLVPVEPGAAPPVFHADCIVIARTACRLRSDFELDAPGLALAAGGLAGCGADAAPYFRIFNPVSQGERFDPHGDYVRRWVPELAALPARWLHQPWNAPQPPADYPPPLVDLRATRRRARGDSEASQRTRERQRDL